MDKIEDRNWSKYISKEEYESRLESITPRASEGDVILKHGDLVKPEDRQDYKEPKNELREVILEGSIINMDISWLITYGKISRGIFNPDRSHMILHLKDPEKVFVDNVIPGDKVILDSAEKDDIFYMKHSGTHEDGVSKFEAERIRAKIKK